MSSSYDLTRTNLQNALPASSYLQVVDEQKARSMAAVSYGCYRQSSMDYFDSAQKASQINLYLSWIRTELVEQVQV